MIRSALAVFLLGAVLAGCSWGYYVNLADVPPRPAGNERASAQPSMQTMRAVAPGSGDTTGTVARPEAVRPWPKRGTVEWNQIQKEELERERRIKETLQSVCRGC